MIHRAPDRRRLRPALAVAGLLASLTAALSCDDRRAGTAAAPAAELAIGYPDPRPATLRQRGIDTLINNLTGERLVGLALDGRPEPALTERWDVAPDGLSWRFTLRPGLTLHDGSPLDARVARGSLEKAIAEAKGETNLLPGFRSVTAIDAAGDRELIVRLSKPNAFLLESINMTPPFGGADGTKSAGPLQFVSRDQTGAVLGAFPGYYRGRPPLERIVIRDFPTPRSAWSAMMRGEIDLLYEVPPDALEFVEKSPSTRVAKFLRSFVTTLVLNQKHPILKRRAVRTALNTAVDRDAMVETTLRGEGQPAYTHVWPKHWAFNHEQPRLAFDTAATVAALDAAGLRAGGAARRARFSFTCLVPTDPPRFEQVAVQVQQQLAQVGIDMRLESVSTPVLLQRVGAGDYDAFLFELGSNFGLQWIYWFWHSSPGSPYMTTHYTAADAPLDALRYARSDEETRVAVHALQRVLHDDPPAVFLFWNRVTRAVSRRFTLPSTPDRDILATISQWRLAKPPSE